MTCECGRDLEDQSRFCDKCGQAVAYTGQTQRLQTDDDREYDLAQRIVRDPHSHPEQRRAAIDRVMDIELRRLEARLAFEERLRDVMSKY